MAKKIFGTLDIRDQEAVQFRDSDSSNFAAIQAPATLAADYTLTLPVDDGTVGQGLSTDGSGALSWVDFLLNTLASDSVFVGVGGSATAVDTAAQGDIAATATGLNIKAGVIVDADINASAAIALNKLAALTANRATETDASGFIVASAVTNTELNYLDGVTSAIQTQFNDLSALVQGLEFQNSALDYVVDNTAAPATEVSGDRYVLSHDGGAPNAAYDGASAGSIVEFDGSVWVETVPTVGMFISADDEDTLLYYWGGASWSTKSFEATTASTGLTKVGLDVQLDASAAGDGLGFAAGVLSANVDDTTIETNADALQVKDGAITDAKVSASAAIALSKLAAVTADRAIISNGSGVLAPSAVTNTELGFVSGVTSAIQTQLDAKAGTALDNLAVAGLAAESLLVGAGANSVANLAVGSNNEVLTVVGGSVEWAALPAANFVATDWITADGTTKVIAHNFGSLDVTVAIYDKSDNADIEVDTVVRTDANTVTLTSSSAPGASGFRVMIRG